MSKTLTVPTVASAAQVRAWARANGHVVGTRGRFAPSLVAAYNKANPVKYGEGKFLAAKSVQVKDSRGKTVTRKISPKVARALLNANGVTTGKRGRLTASQYQAAYDLGKR